MEYGILIRQSLQAYIRLRHSLSRTGVFGEDLATNYPVSMASALTGSLSGKGYISGSGNSNEQVYARFTGLKQYELKDHLGNVRGVVSDLKTATGTGNVPTNDAKVLAYYNYYPFGLQMHGRYNPTDPAGKGGYRFGFNGKEKDDDFNGSIGAIYDYGFRIYDARLARFLSVDPLTRKYPMLTPYQFASNSSIRLIDIDGLEGGILPQVPLFGYYVEQKVNNALEVLKETTDVVLTGTGNLVKGFGEGIKNNVLYGTPQGFGGDIFDLVRTPIDVVQTVEKTVDAFKAFPYASPEDKVTMIETTILAGVGLYYGGKSLVKGFNAPVKPAPSTGILLKDRTPQVGPNFQSLSASVSEGRICISDRAKTHGTFDFVITNEGELRLGTGHYNLSGGAESVQAAGRIKLYDGQVREITNWSGHYQPSILEGEGFGNLLQEGGVNVSGAKLKLYNNEGALQTTKVLE